VRGCFWHQHPGCVHCRVPDSNRDYWEPKLKRTIERDSRNDLALREQGWELVVVWECELKPEYAPDQLAERIDCRIAERL
jgi:DNA mismatch endonuclease (patch repair protein)